MKTIKLLFTIAVTIALFSACNKDEMAIKPDNKGKIIIKARTLDRPGTKVSFTDLGASGVKVRWDSNDGITLYNASGRLAAQFKIITGAGENEANFELVSGSVADGDTYTVVYPATTVPTFNEWSQAINTVTQNGNSSMAHLNHTCYMKKQYVHGNDVVVDFELEYVMMTVKMATPDGYNAAIHGAPTSLSFFNGSYAYNMNITGISDLNSEITVYMLIDTLSSTSPRELHFDLLCGDYLFQKYIKSSKAYEVAKRYTADLSGSYKLEEVEGWELSNFSETNYPASNVWVVIDAIEENTDLSALQAALKYVSENEPTRTIRMVMPNAIILPSLAFEWANNKINCIESFSAPKMVKVKHFAFDQRYTTRDALRTINLPSAKFIESGAFNYNKRLKTVYLPVADTLGTRAFYYCDSITSFSLPEVRGIGRETFAYCSELKSINMPKLRNTNPNIVLYPFMGCLKVTDINLPLVTELGDFCFSTLRKLEYINLPELKFFGKSCLVDSHNLKTVILPKIQSIGEYTFSGANPGNTLTRMELATDPGAPALTFADPKLFMWGHEPDKIDLILGENEYNSPNVDLKAKKWWGNGPFKSITLKQY